MTKTTKELGRKQIAWCNRFIPGFKHTRRAVGAVADRARAVAAARLEAEERKAA